MAAPGRALRTTRLTPGELYRRHVQRKKMIALIAGLLLLPVALLLIVAYDRGPLGQTVSQAFGIAVGDSQKPTPTTAVIAQAASPTPAACQDTVFNGLVFDAETDALLGGVQVEASFGASVVTSPDGEYNILVCYDPEVHDGFSLTFEREGYESGSLDVVTSGYPGIGFQVADLGMYAIQTPTPCQDTVFNGLVFDAETDALLGGVQVEASFGASVVTSPDGEYNILVCYDPEVHDGFSLIFEREGYESGSLDVVTSGYPGISFQVADMGLYALQSVTPVPTLFQPPRQTPLPTPVPTLFQPPRQTPLPTPATDTVPTAAPTSGAGGPAPTAVATAAPPNTLPVTGLPSNPLPGQAVGFVLLAISLMLIAAGVWPEPEDGR